MRKIGIFLLLLVTTKRIMGMQPTLLQNGLAMYKIGEGSPVFVVPYPHAGTLVSIADDSITKCMLAAGKSVITFDPPGAYHSIRPATVDMQEMFDCINETLAAFEIQEPIDMTGHSMGSFCALAYTLRYPQNIKRLLLTGSTSGWNQQRKYGVHKIWKWWRDKEFWQSRYWGAKIYLGLNNLATYTQLNNLVFEYSYYDRSYFHPFPLEKADRKKPVPTRGKWLEQVKNYDYHQQLGTLQVPVLICAGKFDVQTPLIMNEQLHEGITGSKLVIFSYNFV